MKKTRLYLLLLSAAALVLATAGVSYAWFAQNASMATLLDILPPDTITIIPVDRTDKNNVLDELELEFHESTDVKYPDTDIDGKITIYRPVCVKSTNPSHKLEIVHTTNLNDLTFRIYLAEVSGNSIQFSEDPQKDENDRRILLAGNYENAQTNQPKLAKNETLENYEPGDQVEAHAYPLYWLQTDFSSCDTPLPKDAIEVTSYTKEEFNSVSGRDEPFYYTYYYLEISWEEETKQTDLFYIMAHNVA